MISSLKKAHWPWPKMDIHDVAAKTVQRNIYMPGIGYTHVAIDDGWQVELGEAANSKKLWLNSLVSCHACLKHAVDDGIENPEYLNSGAEFLARYLEQYDSHVGIFEAAWKDEHAVANRLFVITAFLHELFRSPAPKHILSQVSDYISPIVLLNHARRHANWLNEDSNYVHNNHGVMMDFALAQYSIFMKTIDPIEAEQFLSTALRRLTAMFDRTFDESGCCTENSPSYHFVNYSLFSAIDSILKENGHGVINDTWQERLKKVKRVGGLLLRPDGSLPTIGDSEDRLGNFFPTDDETCMQDGVGFFPNAGFFVAKFDNCHFTLRAGGISFSHRHVDDLSFTLWNRGKDFIVDSGLYNHDISDPVRRWFISSRAHSGFYLESQGDPRYVNFGSPHAMSRFIDISVDDYRFRVIATHDLSKEAAVKREVRYSDGILSVEDSFLAKTEQRWRSQFLLHPNVKLQHMDGKSGFELVNGDEKVFMRILNDKWDFYIEEARYSNQFMKIIPSKAIIIRGLSCAENLQIEFDICK